VLPKKKSAAVAMKVVGPKNLTRAEKAAKKSATRKDPPATIGEAPTNLPAVTLADTSRYLSCFFLLLFLACLSRFFLPVGVIFGGLPSLEMEKQ
jgi:hypothetical protein